MWEKIKEFFSNATVKIVAWVVLFLDIVALIIGGATEADISKAVTLALAGIAAIGAIVAFICEKVKNK